ncbi:SDR family NAD(P)-dependent oxidoreductase [Thalassotalea sp. 1_MG-2023]|uniref:SDR family oxidoreductase n=1 Tax=Thalassotalea sp. 1_MG-2023 TaxID=3062680 RepID=UPI0026E3ADB6|nr:SDR family NAD(P)-dependent oxidoreductase [Thalassotalea sp. 1_MG-2023]MDO6428577.1 SDR family NAD(P)-dependent oxidoreductase [Thalassotalea sp. 1_MG-2023]
MKLKNRRIVITGGTSGIGYQLVKQLFSANELIVIARDQYKLNALREKFSGITTLKADLARPTETKAVAEKIVNEYQYIDLLINNAAVQYCQHFIDDTFLTQQIIDEVNVNLTSVCMLTHQLLPTLLHQEKAIILNVNSGLALAPKTSSAVYCATKAALNNFSQSLRYQLAKTNIQVQQVFLPLVDTPMTTGRGVKKLSVEQAAYQILTGLENEVLEHALGKVKLLKLLLRFTPSIAKNIMKKY